MGKYNTGRETVTTQKIKWKKWTFAVAALNESNRCRHV